MLSEPEKILAALREPFDPGEVGWKPQAVKGNRCYAVGYIDARAVMNRLDEVLGIINWRDEFIAMQHGCVECRLSLRINGEWITRSDIGCESDQKDEGDRMKAAYSDALKRAAVKWGIGRYLYNLDGGWVDYDEAKKTIINPPRLPSWAIPKPPMISQEQCIGLLRIAEDVTVDMEALLRHYQIGSMKDLPLSKYADCLEKLERKKSSKPK